MCMCIYMPRYVCTFAVCVAYHCRQSDVRVQLDGGGCKVNFHVLILMKNMVKLMLNFLVAETV